MQETRFAKLSSNPRFRRKRKKMANFHADQRFSKSNFNEFSDVDPTVDKYGKKTKTGTPIPELEEVDSDLSKFVEHPLASNAVKLGKSTSRLAVQNLDWDNIKSNDLFAIFSGFLPIGGCIKKVSVYVSDFGKERLDQESLIGPPQSIFKPVLEDEREMDECKWDVHQIESKSFSDNESGNSNSDLEVVPEVVSDDDKDFNEEELRKYQLERLQYYYAIVECDSTETAQSIYDSCDGTEFEKSMNFFDLRFVPNDIEFLDTPRDSCAEFPCNFKPKNFSTNVLEHSKLKLSWDLDDPERTRVTRRPYTEQDLDEADFKSYLADSGSEDLDISLYKDLLKTSNDELKEEVEITFTAGLDDKIGGQMEEQEKTLFEKYQEDRKKKKKARLQLQRKSEVTSTKTSEKSNTRELDLLFDDSIDFSSRSLKKRDNFVVNVTDPRFRDVFESDSYAIDPTNQQFRSSENIKLLMKEKRDRKKKY